MEEQFEDFKNASFEEKKEIISGLGIYELRGVARALGVPSPTTKKRDYLIDSIMSLLKNDNVEVVQNVTKGRPFKKLESVDTILNLLGDNNIKEIELPKEYSYENIILFAQEVPVFEYESKELTKKSGVLRVSKKNSYFVDMTENKIVFVPNEILSKNDLQSGDFVECVAYKINEKDQYFVKEVLKINHIFVNNYVAEVKPFKQRVLPKNTLNLGSKQMILGSRNFVCIDDPLFLESEVSDIVLQANRLNKRLVFLGLDLCAEDMMLAQKLNNFLKFTTEYGKDNTVLNFNKVVDVINYCERLSRYGESVLLVIYDVSNILHLLDEYYLFINEEKKGSHYQQSMIILEKLISLASVYSDGSECTSILICNNVDFEDEFVKNKILKISRKMK